MGHNYGVHLFVRHWLAIPADAQSPGIDFPGNLLRPHPVTGTCQKVNYGFFNFQGPLSVLLKVILLPQCNFSFLILMGEIVLPAGAEIDVPAPDTAGERLGIVVVLCPEGAGFAGVMLFCHCMMFLNSTFTRFFQRANIHLSAILNKG